MTVREAWYAYVNFFDELTLKFQGFISWYLDLNIGQAFLVTIAAMIAFYFVARLWCGDEEEIDYDYL